MYAHRSINFASSSELARGDTIFRFFNSVSENRCCLSASPASNDSDPSDPPMTKMFKSLLPSVNAAGHSWNVVLPLLTGSPVVANEANDPL